MRRRALLASTSSTALALLGAGCLGTDAGTPSKDKESTTDAGPTARSQTRTDEGPRTVGFGDDVDLPRTSVELGSLSLQSSFVEHAWPTWDAHARSDHVFAVVRLSGADRARELLDEPPVGVRVDGERYAETTAYARADSGAPVEFAAAVPTGRDADSAALVLDAVTGEARYPLDAEQLAALRDPPAFDVTPRIPDGSSEGSLSYALDVRNTGDSLGALVATSTHDAIHDRYWTSGTTVDPGDTETIEFEPYAPSGEDSYELEITADWGFDTVEQTVRVDAGPSTAD